MSDTGGTQFARGTVAVACADDGDFILTFLLFFCLLYIQNDKSDWCSRCSTSLITSALVGSSPLNPGPAIVEK